ncbi:hypothetical protein KEM60_01238 [Austwickia sp. TVS 96-490-7B]|uniref:MFS transporter n=1 Tax=Austwickia sp. TVS 96-490-7B TaxID=2830843 RepID=UPI001C5A41F5|nr:MFS transporter [Austwickia sp. TVS 96-490-7B]MBW3085046.1 hypothetical protein [Austwickia sp. TVS 96-490-7B]
MAHGPPSSTDASHRIFVQLWSAQLVLVMLSSSSGLVLALTLYERTTSVAVLAAATSLGLVGSIYGAPWIGAVIDRFSRKTAVVAANCGCGLSAWVLCFTLATDLPTGVVLVVVGVSGLAAAALSLTMQATVRLLRTEEDLTRVNGVLTIVENLPVFVGPLLGSAIYATGHQVLIFAVEGCASLMVAGFVASRSSFAASDLPPSRPRSIFAGVRYGLRFILHHPDLRVLQLTFTFFNVANGVAAAVCTAYVIAGTGESETAGHGATRLTVSTWCGSAGLLLGSALVFVLAGRVRRSAMVVGGMACGAVVGRIFFALSASVVTMIPTLTCRNATVQVTNAPLTALWQERTPVDVQGSVFGARRLLGQGLYPVATLCGGFLVDVLTSQGLGRVLSMQLTIAGCGVGELGCALFLAGSGVLARSGFESRLGSSAESPPGA